MHHLEQRLALLQRIVAAGFAEILEALRELCEALRIVGERHHVLHRIAAALTAALTFALARTFFLFLVKSGENASPSGAFTTAGPLAQYLRVVDLLQRDRLVPCLLPRLGDAADPARLFR